MKILYIHGFKSSEKAKKAQILKRKFNSVISPTIPVSPAEAIQFLDNVIINETPGFIIGSSLGGFYAFYLTLKYKIACLLINPSMTPWITLKKHVGIHTRFLSNDKFEWKKEHNDELEEISKNFSKYKINERLFNFFISTDDELLNHSNLTDKFKNSEIHYFDNYGHQFIRFTNTIPLLKKIINKYESI